ncbi:PucR family transcriptional regulator [Streptomyces capparidis]
MTDPTTGGGAVHTGRDPASATPAVPLASLLDGPCAGSGRAEGAARGGLGLRQLAGPDAAGVPVHWVHTSELEDPAPYLLGGELLLTAGVHVPVEGTDAYLDRYAARVARAGAAALGFGVAPLHDTVPRALVAACERYGLPLLEVPPRTPFVAVARAVWLAVSEARHQELRRMAEAQRGLATAAGGPDPVPAVLRRLAGTLDAWVVLLDERGRELHTAGARPGDPVPADLVALAAELRGGRATAADHARGRHLAVHALPGSGLALGVAASRQDAVDRSVAGVAAVLLSLLTGPRRGVAAAEGAAGALVRLLLGTPPREAAPLLGEGPWTVVRGRGARPQDAGAAATALGAALGTPFVDVDGTELRALLPAGAEVSAQPGWTLGVSAPASPDGLAGADGQAERALRRALGTGVPVARHRAGDRGVSALVSPAEAAALARERLAPLAGSPALVETLRTWLSLHGGWDHTAAALGVHRNTVRQRIARIGALLDCDLGDADVRMELWFALSWLPGQGDGAG